MLYICLFLSYHNGYILKAYLVMTDPSINLNLTHFLQQMPFQLINILYMVGGLLFIQLLNWSVSYRLNV